MDRCENRRCSTTHARAPLPERTPDAARNTPTCRSRPRWSKQPNALVLRRCRDHDRSLEARPAVTTCPTRSTQPGTAIRGEMPQPARMKNDPESVFLRPYNDLPLSRSVFQRPAPAAGWAARPNGIGGDLRARDRLRIIELGLSADATEGSHSCRANPSCSGY